MSAIYNLEPQPTASAILHTTLGEISVELFAKQTPLTCRNFLQLALDGYYDGTVFHRLVSGFIVQGGDPTGTGNGGESIYDGGALSGDLDPWPMEMRRGRNAGEHGVNFRDEFHSRLKFNRRGLLGMANDGRADSNGSQFFFTLDKAEELNGKNTLFGRVAGETIYNLAKIGESEVVEGTDRPMYPVKIDRVEILVNPFDDMKKRERVAVPSTAQKKKPEKRKKRKGGKQLLSFGDEEGGEEEEVPVPKKAKFDTRIIAEEEEEEEEEEGPVPKQPKPKSKKETRVPPKERPPRETPPKETQEKEVEEVQQRQKKEEEETGKRCSPTASPSPSPEPERQKTALERANEEMAAIKASLRRTVHTEAAVRPEKRKKSTLDSMIPENSVRGARKRRPGTAAREDPEVLRMLDAFKSKLGNSTAATTTTPPEKKKKKKQQQQQDHGKDHDGGADAGEADLCDLHFIANCQSCTAWDENGAREEEEEEEDDDMGWMSHSLSFAADRLGKDLSNRKKAEEELVVIDPREKARSFKESKRAAERRGGGGGSSSSRQWDQKRDQARNAKLAQASSLAGRGAK
ncbi:peptidyl-prolyl cis-trans isomerase SDCCAG10 [Geosmithia morbida]|uniref:peptidylprolyl isomerase n=1 Tax=Geosmithia morbida TaxID=1094350 RepID=A0A9P4YW70_9HYPO|nr:peptidyl-prolyl cis-trans isomerase SDCCAG10 [Geosmithia morbida]KAF4123657.1 peptidyl-prolyl cis-trans isomerase SDCCAG10 [Geosmithia morbida]